MNSSIRSAQFKAWPGLFALVQLLLSAHPPAALAAGNGSDGASPLDDPQLLLLAPKDGATFPDGTAIVVEALALDAKGFIARIEFLADGVKIGESALAWPACVGCEPKPGEVARHTFDWKDAPSGSHTLVARATERVVFQPKFETQPLDPPVASPPILVSVGRTPSVSKLSLEATRAVAEESSFPYRRLPLTGEFLIRRTGDLSVPANVMILYEGEAVNGADCEPLPKELEIPAGTASIAIEVKAIPDDLPEGAEKLIARLLPAPSPSGAQVEIDWGRDQAAVVICDDSRCGQPATLEITSPKSGGEFPAGTPIEVNAVAVDPLGAIYRVEFWAGEQPIGFSEVLTFREPDPGTPMKHAFVWKDAPSGMHTLTARAKDSAGSDVISPPVRILVEALPATPFVERRLPAAYTPAQPFEVQLVATPPQAGSAWAVAERPPKGWIIGAVSDDGVWDSAQGLVKYGPFTDLAARTLTYQITPPTEARGRYLFSGEAALDGRVAAIGGDRILEPVNETHPADLEPTDLNIGLSEVTAYAAAWKEGAVWPAGPVPIPVSYATRAGQIWKQGERYVYDPSLGAPPECWVPASSIAKPGLRRVADPGAERSLSQPVKPGASVEIALDLTPAHDVAAYAVEEVVPAGWAFDSADQHGVFDPLNHRLRWGPFFDAQPRRLTYRLKSPAATARLDRLHGVASFDGHDQRIAGAQFVLAVDTDTAPRVRGLHFRGRGLRFEIAGLPGQVCEVESSTDLSHWVPHCQVFVPEAGVAEVEDLAPAGPARFFRVRPGSGE